MFAEVRLASVPAHVSCLEPCLSSPLGSHQPWDLQRDGEIDGRLMRGLMGKAGTGQSLAVKTSALGIEESQKSSVTSAPCTAFWRQEDLWVRLYPRGIPHLRLCREAADHYPFS